MSMVYQTKSKGKDYFIIYTTLTINEGETVIKIPLTIQTNITKLDVKHHFILSKKLVALFGKPIVLPSIQTKSRTKPSSWLSFWNKK